MAVHKIGIATADLKVPRWHPCSATVNRIMNMDILCMATPTAQYIRSCGTDGHTEKIWLCPIHAAMCVTMMAICKRCAERDGVRFITLERITDPLRT